MSLAILCLIQLVPYRALVEYGTKWWMTSICNRISSCIWLYVCVCVGIIDMRNLYHRFPGFHNRWNRSVQVPHPNLWTFIRKMKDECKRIHLTLSAAKNGQCPPTKRLLYRRTQKRIRQLKRRYNRGTTPLNVYWRAVSHTIHVFN